MDALLAIPDDLKRRFNFVRWMRLNRHVFLEWTEPNGSVIAQDPCALDVPDVEKTVCRRKEH